MAQYTQTVTQAGYNVIAAGQNSQIINATRVQVGSGVLASNVDPSLQTGLISPVMNAAIGAKLALGGGQFLIKAVVDSKNVTNGFLLNEIGVWTTSGGGAEQLYSYVQTKSNAVFIEPASASTGQRIWLDLVVAFGPGNSVTITLSDGVYASEQELLDHEHDPNAHTEGFAAHNADPAANPAAINRHNTDQNAHVGLFPKVQLTNLSVRVIASGTPDNTTTFASISAAYNYLLQYYFYPTVQVAINVDPAAFTVSSPILCNHPQGSQIKIVGASLTSTLITGSATLTQGAAPFYSLSFSVNSTAGIAVGDYVGLMGDQLVSLDGYWKVIGLTGSQLTLQIVSQNSISISSNTRLTSAAIIKFPTKINYTGASGACFNISPGGLNSLQNLGITGTRNANTQGIYSFSPNTLVLGFVGVSGFGKGLAMAGSGANLTLINNNHFCDCLVNGIEATNLVSIAMNPGQLNVSGCAGSGISLSSNSAFFANDSLAIVGIGNGVGAVALAIGSKFFCASNLTGRAALLYANSNLYGIVADSDSAAFLTGSVDSHQFLNNTGFDFYALGGGKIIGLHVGSSPHTASPTNHTTAADGSYIGVTA